jgi:Tfp pilus assembly protein PilZ
MSLQDPFITHELFQKIVKMSDDERRTLLNLLQNGLLKGRCRRNHYRKALRLPVQYVSRGRTYSGYTRNVSFGGLFLPTRFHFSMGQGLIIAFLHQGRHSYLKVTGEVVRISPEGIGVRFNPLDQRQKSALLSLTSAAAV